MKNPRSNIKYNSSRKRKHTIKKRYRQKGSAPSIFNVANTHPGFWSGDNRSVKEMYKDDDERVGPILDKYIKLLKETFPILQESEIKETSTQQRTHKNNSNIMMKDKTSLDIFQLHYDMYKSYEYNKLTNHGVNIQKEGEIIRRIYLDKKRLYMSTYIYLTTEENDELNNPDNYYNINEDIVYLLESEENYINKFKDQIKNSHIIQSALKFKTDIKIKPEVQNINIINTHGNMMDTIFTIPDDLMICFITPTNKYVRINAVNDYIIENLLYDKYEDIFNDISCFADAKNNICFKNAVYMYPGQKYFDIELSKHSTITGSFGLSHRIVSNGKRKPLEKPLEKQVEKASNAHHIINKYGLDTFDPFKTVLSLHIISDTESSKNYNSVGHTNSDDSDDSDEHINSDDSNASNINNSKDFVTSHLPKTSTSEQPLVHSPTNILLSNFINNYKKVHGEPLKGILIISCCRDCNNYLHNDIIELIYIYEKMNTLLNKSMSDCKSLLEIECKGNILFGKNPLYNNDLGISNGRLGQPDDILKLFEKLSSPLSPLSYTEIKNIIIKLKTSSDFSLATIYHDHGKYTLLGFFIVYNIFYDQTNTLRGPHTIDEAKLMNQIIPLLIDDNKSVLTISQGVNNMTPIMIYILQFALILDHSVVTLLIDEKKDVLAICDSRNNNPLNYYLYMLNNASVYQELMKKNNNNKIIINKLVNILKPGHKNLTSQNADTGDTSLLTALDGNINIDLKLLIDNTDILFTPNFNGEYPLNRAIKNGRSIDDIKLLIDDNKYLLWNNLSNFIDLNTVIDTGTIVIERPHDYNTDIDIVVTLNDPDRNMYDMKTILPYQPRLICIDTIIPVVTAIIHGASDEVIKILIDDNSKTIADKMGYLPIHHAVKKGIYKNDILKLLISENKNELITQNKDGDTPLHIAIKQNHIAMYDILMRDDVLSIPNYDGNLPLHIYMYQTNILDTYKLLQPNKLEAALSHINKQRQTPLHIALYKKHFNLQDGITIIKKLVGTGKYILSMKDIFNNRPLDIIIHENNADLTKLLTPPIDQ